MTAPYKDTIVMFEVDQIVYVGPMFYDDKGNSIVCANHLGKDKIFKLKDLKQWYA